MKRKILFVFLALIIVIIIAVTFFVAFQNRASSEKYCETDNDCACGVRIGTGDCFYGNRNFVNVSRQCPDFCNGIAAHLIIKCVSNECVQVNTLNQ